MSLTHQDVVDRLDALGKEHGRAYALERARIAKERESLQELCGGLGHVFGASRWGDADSKACLICGKCAARPA